MDRTFLVLVLLICGLVTVPQVVDVGGTSGLGVWTMLISAGAWVIWLVRPYFPRELAAVLFPLAFFVMYAVFSLAWGGVNTPAIQNLAVSIGFLGFMLLTARECERSPKFAANAMRAIDVAAVVAGVCYLLTFIAFGQGADAQIGGRPLFMARGFALFAIVAVARQLARWHAGERAGLWIAGFLVLMVFLSHSRLAMVVTLALFPLSFLLRGDRRGVLAAVMMGLAGVVVLGGVLMVSETMQERFFGRDASLSVGGVSINGEGRAAMWGFLVDHLQRWGGWKFGHGAGAASVIIEKYFPGLGHPHNDFLRFIYDYGLVGLAGWLAFLGTVSWMLWRASRWAWSAGHADFALFASPLLALTGITVSMFTDNSVSYIYVMAPMAVMLGCALSRMRMLEIVARSAQKAARMPAPLPWARPPRGAKALPHEWRRRTERNATTVPSK